MCDSLSQLKITPVSLFEMTSSFLPDSVIMPCVGMGTIARRPLGGARWIYDGVKPDPTQRSWCVL